MPKIKIKWRKAQAKSKRIVNDLNEEVRPEVRALPCIMANSTASEESLHSKLLHITTSVTETQSSELRSGWLPTSTAKGNQDTSLIAPPQERRRYHDVDDEDELKFVHKDEFGGSNAREFKRRRNASAQAAFRQRRQDYIRVPDSSVSLLICGKLQAAAYVCF
jgi:hypothetical protein